MVLDRRQGGQFRDYKQFMGEMIIKRKLKS